MVKYPDILLIVIAVLLVLIAAELAVVINAGNANAKLAVSSNQELAASNAKLEAVMADVGEELKIVVNKFCGGRKRK
ncbi:MAG: hypothetical protein KKD29_06515 [Candidatus Omnitrophica bacterium]|nr:hypothetical protein [Candidatus Omnitrophota bacterium]MBU4488140.1 hypothetical protein [Candidatus Omnitrophota bacterium]MCG2704527.1 hypothetical protein [Candidatus Omnitrophota bacterium]